VVINFFHSNFVQSKSVLSKAFAWK